MLPTKFDGKPAVATRTARPRSHCFATRWFACQVQYISIVGIFVGFSFIDLDHARVIAMSIFLASMSSVVIWLARASGADGRGECGLRRPDHLLESRGRENLRMDRKGSSGHLWPHLEPRYGN
jgi:hypothetical protein